MEVHEIRVLSYFQQEIDAEGPSALYQPGISVGHFGEIHNRLMHWVPPIIGRMPDPF
jgi:hypothetical protein